MALPTLFGEVPTLTGEEWGRLGDDRSTLLGEVGCGLAAGLGEDWLVVGGLGGRPSPVVVGRRPIWAALSSIDSCNKSSTKMTQYQRVLVKVVIGNLIFQNLTFVNSMTKHEGEKLLLILDLHNMLPALLK